MSIEKIRRVRNQNPSTRIQRKKSGYRDFVLERRFQEIDRRVSELQSQFSKMFLALQRIENRLATFEIEKQKNIGQTDNLSPSAITNSAAKMQLVAKLVQEDEVNCKADERQLNDYYSQAKHWAHRSQMLCDAIASTLELCESKLFPECQKLKEELPPGVQEKLQERDRGLEIIGRMLKRLFEPARELNEAETPNRQLPSATQKQLSDIITAEDTNEESARQAIAQKLKEIGNQRYKYIAEMRELAEKRRKRWQNFVEKKVLPILDGIENGQRYSEPLVNQLKDENPNLVTKLDLWFQTYINLRAILLQALEQVQVYPMQVKTKMPIDYTRHEPFDVQSDDRLPNEYIKEIIRQGYEYRIPGESSEVQDLTNNSKTFQVLRPAQVVVVKN